MKKSYIAKVRSGDFYYIAKNGLAFNLEIGGKPVKASSITDDHSNKTRSYFLDTFGSVIDEVHAKELMDLITNAGYRCYASIPKKVSWFRVKGKVLAFSFKRPCTDGLTQIEIPASEIKQEKPVSSAVSKYTPSIGDNVIMTNGVFKHSGKLIAITSKFAVIETGNSEKALNTDTYTISKQLTESEKIKQDLINKVKDKFGGLYNDNLLNFIFDSITSEYELTKQKGIIK